MMVSILLDIDGVMVTTPPWKRPDMLEDGFMKFADKAVENINRLLSIRKTNLIVTSSHRDRFSKEAWLDIFRKRNMVPDDLFLLHELADLTGVKGHRKEEISLWYDRCKTTDPFVIIDDDVSLHGLPSNLKQNWVQTFMHSGFDDAAFNRAAELLDRMQGS